VAETFATQEWVDELWGVLRGDDALRSAGAGWAHGPVALVIEAEADKGFEADVVVRLDLHQGEVRDMRLVDSVPVVPFAVAGSYSRWKSLVQGERDLYDAIESSQFRLRGDLTAIARHRDLWRRFVALARSAGAVWPDETEAAAPVASAR
jgi:hypothetical protein